MNFKKLFLNLDSLIILFLIIIILQTFRQLHLTFYQQDEWLGAGQIIAGGIKGIFEQTSFLDLIIGFNRPFSRFFGGIIFELYPFDPTPLAIYNIILHILNSILVYLIINY